MQLTSILGLVLQVHGRYAALGLLRPLQLLQAAQICLGFLRLREGEGGGFYIYHIIVLFCYLQIKQIPCGLHYVANKSSSFAAGH